MAALTELQLLILDRWSDAQALVAAFDELEDVLGDRLVEAGADVGVALAVHGFKLADVDKRYAEVRATKPQWCRPDGEPLVTLAVGGVFPYGFRKVNSDFAYVWAYASGFEKDEAKAFQQRLGDTLGPRAFEWTNDDCDYGQPAGKWLEEYGDGQRTIFAKDPAKLAAFLKEQFEVALQLESAIDASLGRMHQET